jgi:cyclic peptide transporter
MQFIKRTKVVLFLTGTLVFLSVWLFPATLFAQDSPDSLFSGKADSLIRKWMDKGNIPGLSVVIINGSKESIKTYGYRDISKKALVTENTLFELGSCSKAFTSLAVYQLIAGNKLDPQADVAKYIPWWHVSWHKKPAIITVSQLLHHTSGIPWNTISDIPEGNGDNALEQTVKTLSGQELSHQPGKQFEYATINYDVLALIIQRITHRSFEDYLQQEVLNRLGLKSATIGTPSDNALMATGYKTGFFKARPYDAPRFRGNNAAGYVIANAADLGAWLKFQMGLVDTGALYDAARQTHLKDESVPIHGMAAYGSGWEIALDGTGTIFHGGWNPNFTAYVAQRPDRKIGIALMANSNSPYTAFMGNELIHLMAGEKPERRSDPGDNNDKTYSLLTIILLLYMLTVLAYLGRIIVFAAKGKRKYQPMTGKKAGRFILGLIMIAPFVYGFYILPHALAGFSWKSILVWSPVSFAVMVACMALAAGISYLTHFISLCFPETDPYKKAVPRIVLMSVLSGLANVVIIIMVTSSLNTTTKLKYIIFYYALALLVYLLTRRFVQIRLVRLTRGLVYDLKIQLIDKIFSTSYQKFEKIERGRIYTTINDDINTIGESTNVFMMLITSIITACGAFLFLAFIAFWATLLTILLIVSLAALYSMVAQQSNRYFKEARDERNVFMGLVNGMIDGFKEIGLHRNKKLAFKNDVAASAHAYKIKMSLADIKFVNAFLVGESLLVVLLGMVAFGMPELFPDIENYTLMSFVIILLYLIVPINAILSYLPGMMQFRIAWDRIRGFTRDIPANLDLSQPLRTLIAPVESIRLEGVRFQYRDQDDKHFFAVGPIDLEVRRGEILFIIGGNGSGKTTLAKLLTGLYEPDAGMVLINDQPVEPSRLGEYFSTVFSPSFLFQKLYNIDTQARQEETNQYLQMLDLDGKVTIDDNRYSTIDLSGGQRKRLALLQCYLEDSPICLFDEWAADQDPEYRHFFYRTLLPEMKRNNKIIIAITHDDHYFDVADKVLKMNQGQLELFSNEYSITG